MNPFASSPVGRIRDIEEDQSFRARASRMSISDDHQGMADNGDGPQPGGYGSTSSDIVACPYRSRHETETCPTERMLLGEMFITRPYQIGPCDRECSERIGRLHHPISAYEEADRVRPWDPQQRAE